MDNNIFEKVKEEYLKIVLDIIQKEKNELKIQKEQDIKYEQYSELISIIKMCNDDLSKVNEIDETKEIIASNEILKKAIIEFKYLPKYAPENQEILTENKHAYINWIIKIIKEEMSNIEKVKEIDEKIKKLEEKESIIKNNRIESIDDLYNLLINVYNQGLLTTEQVVNLNINISKRFNEEYKQNSMSNESRNEEVYELEENQDDIKDSLIKLYKEYGYNYESLNAKEKINLEKYAKIEYVKEVLKFLSENNISIEDYESRQNAITNIIIFPDREALEKIKELLEKNDFSLKTLLAYPAYFYQRKRKFKFKNQKNDTNEPPREIDILPCGELESFEKNIEYYKYIKGYPEDYRITDKDLMENNVTYTTFFCTPYEKIEYNIEIMKMYGLINENYHPNITTAYVGANIEYILDRAVELDLLDYIKKNSSILSINDFPFRWYKIKLAKDIKDEAGLFSGRGLRRELKNDKEDYLGIKLKDRSSIIRYKIEDITQECLDEKYLIPQQRFYPGKSLEEIYELLYKYEEPIKALESYLQGQNQGLSLTDIVNNDIFKILNSNLPKHSIKNIKSVEEDPYIKLLDQSPLVKKDNLTYEFNGKNYENCPNVIIRISRQKVLKLCALLKEKNSWINDSMKNEDKINLLFYVLLKDSITSKIERDSLRKIILEEILKKSLNLDEQKKVIK